MKKFLSVVLAAMLTLTGIGTVSFAQAEDAAEVAEETAETTSFISQITENGSAIPNTYAKIKKGEDIHLGYFGGSVTNGYAPSNAYNPAPQQGVNCWRGLSQTWLHETYGVPNGITIMETNSNTGAKKHAGLGGTGIDLNLYRANNALGLSTTDPVDLLFIEFSINDSYEGNTYEKSAFFMESTIKMIREKSPTTDIVIMLTTDHGKLAASKDGTEVHMNAQAHIDVAEYYNIPWFWFGGYMYDFLVEENVKLGNSAVLPSSGSELWQTYMADGCHPSPRGYQKYFEFLRDNFLIPNLDDTKGYSTEVVNYTCPEVPYNATQEFLDNFHSYHPGAHSIYHNARLRSNATDIVPRNFGTAGYGYNPAGGNVTKDSYDNPGMAWSVKTKAQSVGMYYRGHPTMGLIQYRVDGGEWKYANMYTSGNNQNEYFMFFEDLEEKERVVDVILRKTLNGDDWSFRSIFLEGDSTGFGAEILQGAPNNKPLNDLVKTPIVLTPALLNTKISGGGYTNSGSDFSVYHLGITDTDVLRYIPNPESSDNVASDCYNSTLKSVSIPDYKYAVIRYYYELEPGTTEVNAEGNRHFINFLQLANGDPKACGILSADKIVLGGTSAHTSIIDLLAITARTGHTGNLHQMHFYPFGNNVAGSALAETELMNIESIMFYADYPFSDEYEIEVAVDKTVTATAQEIDLSGKRILPSAHRYAKVKYTAAEDAKLTFGFEGLYNGDYSASKTAPAGEGEIVMNLTEIAESGQIDYYTKVKLSADKEIDIESITFCVNYPDPNAEFTVNFDANGGTGTLPEAVTGKIGTIVTLPAASLEKGSQLFLGWATSPDATETVSNFEVPVDGATLYAIYADAATLTYNANGGTGAAPASVKVLVGRDTTLVSGNLTKEGHVFIGWGTSADATTPISSVTMDADGVTVYAIYKALQTVYVTNNESGKFTYNGEEVTADYATLSDALAALGANGGHIIFEGGFDDDDFFPKQNSSAPIIILEGASDNAILRTEATGAVNAKLLCDTTLKNVTILRGINENGSNSDTYINGNAKTLILDVGTKTHNEAGERGSYQIGNEAALQGYTFRKLILNDGKISNNFHLTQYGNASSGNVYYEINGGTPGDCIQAGSLNFSEKTMNHNGNITVVVNGGNLANGQKVLIDKSATVKTSVSGATTVIVNNGLAASKSMTFDPKFKYIVKSSAGGKVTLAAEGSSSYAPTFLIKAINPDAVILVNGEEVESVNGEYLFMPKSGGTFDVTYKGATKVYVNGDGSGKLTVDGVEHTAYATIAEAAANLDAAGGTIYFDGEQSYFEVEDASNLGFKKLTVRGVGESSVLVFDTKAQTVGFGCDVAIENCHLREEANQDVWLRTGAHVVTFGNPDDTMTMKYLTKAGTETSAQCIVTGSGGKYVIYNCNFGNLGRDWSGTHNTDVVIEINGGKVSASGIGAYFGGGTLNANMAVSVNGVALSGTAIDFEKKGTVNGNSILVFNGGAMHLQTYTISNVDYVVDAPAGIKVDIANVGSSSAAPTFTLTPAADVEKIFVNKSEVSPVNGVYTYTPTAAGTFVVEADLVLPAVTFVAGEGTTGNAPANVTALAGADVTIPTCDLSKEGKRLAGWATTEGLVNPEYTTTVKMPEGGITLYPVWRDADKIFVAASGKLTYDGVEYVADYTDLNKAQEATGAIGVTYVFTGSFDFYKTMDWTYGKAPYVTFEGVGNEGILTAGPSASAINVKPYTAQVNFKNVKFLKLRGTTTVTNADSTTTEKEYVTDLYFNGNGKSVTFGEGTETYTEEAKGTGKLGAKASLQGYNFASVTAHSGNFSENFHIGGYVSNSSGNKYLEIGGTASFATPINLGVLDWGSNTRTHNGNITLVINGGVFNATHWINVDKGNAAGKLTNVNGAVSVIINNGIADTTTFAIDSKVEYVIESAKGGTVTLAEEGSETAAPKFLIKADANKAILIDGEKVEDVNGEYIFTPADKDIFVVTYEEKPTKVEVNVTFGDKNESSAVVVDSATGFDGRATLTIEGMEEPIYLESAGSTEETVTGEVHLTSGEHAFKVTKPGYITYEGTVTVKADGTFDMPEIPTLIAGDIRNSFDTNEGDGKIDLDDFIRVLRGFSGDESENKLLRQSVDLNEDGAVNVSDLAIIKANYGKTADAYSENN